MTELLQALVTGLGYGSVYAMVGMGLVIIFRSTGLLNLAQGEIAMFSTFIVWQFHEWGLPLWVAMFAGSAAGFVIGALLFRVAIQPLGDAHTNPLPMVIATIGIFLAINSAASLVWPAETRGFPRLFGNGSWIIGGVAIRHQIVGALAVLALEVVAFSLLFGRTRLGLAMRAVASNSESSALAGVPVTRMLMIGWGLAAAVGAIAGTFTAPDRTIDPNLMLLTIVYAFAAIALGGFDSLLGAVVGGLAVGVLQVVVPKYVTFFDGMDLAPAFIVILLVLLVRPTGLFGSKRVSRV